MWKARLLCPIVVFVLLIWGKKWIVPAFSCESFSKSWSDEADLGIGSLLGVKGASLAVFNNFEIEWTHSWGYSHESEVVTSDTLFQAASTSKPVAALTSVIAAKHGYFNLDDDINELLEYWNLENRISNDSSWKVTPRMLLSHTAGTSVWGFEGYEYARDAPDLLGVLDGKGNSEKVEVLHFEPGSRWLYSGGGCLVQQLALEVTTGTKLEDLARKWVFEPSQMNSSQFEQPLSDQKKLERAAHAHRDGKPFHVPFKVYPELAAAGLWKTASDYARFLIGLQKALSSDDSGLIRSMISPVGVGRYGVGFQLYTRDVPPVFGLPYDTGPDVYFGHSGRNFGFTAMTVAHVSKGHGLALFVNDEDTNLDLFEEIINRVAIKYGWSDAKVYV